MTSAEVSPPTTPEGEAAVMPLMEHLKELRNRLFRAAIALLITTAISFLIVVPPFARPAFRPPAPELRATPVPRRCGRSQGTCMCQSDSGMRQRSGSRAAAAQRSRVQALAGRLQPVQPLAFARGTAAVTTESL